MSSERPEEFSEPPVSRGRPASDDGGGSETAGNHGPSDDATRHETTVVVRGETIRDQEPKSRPKDKEKSPRKEVSEAKIKMQSRLPVLDDDPDVGIQKEQLVIRDGKADLAFTGTLLASAAPPSGVSLYRRVAMAHLRPLPGRRLGGGSQVRRGQSPSLWPAVKRRLTVDVFPAADVRAVANIRTPCVHDCTETCLVDRTPGLTSLASSNSSKRAR